MGDSWQFDQCGGHLAIDYSNTVSSRHDAPIERLVTYDDLVSFGEQTELLSKKEAADYRAKGKRAPAEAASALRDAQTLREALYQIFAALARGDKPRRADMIVLNAQLARFRLNDAFEWEWVAQYEGLDAFLGPIVRAGVDLLTGARDRVSMCEADDCVWVFLDTSKNHSRRWCDMAQCGNRAKARRFQKKRKTRS